MEERKKIKVKCNERSRLLSLSAQKRHSWFHDRKLSYRFLGSYFSNFLEVSNFTLIHIHYYPTYSTPTDHKSKTRQRKRLFVEEIMLKTRNKNKGQNEHLANLLKRTPCFSVMGSISSHIFLEIL